VHSRRRLTSDDIRNRLRAACTEAGGVRQWAQQNGLTKGYVFQVLQGDKQPSAAIAKPLGYWRVVGLEPLHKETDS
jgi:hypothetical protein